MIRQLGDHFSFVSVSLVELDSLGIEVEILGLQFKDMLLKIHCQIYPWLRGNKLYKLRLMKLN